MTELDDRLRKLQGLAREWCAELRPHSLAADRDPDRAVELAHLPALGRLATLQVPPEYNPDPLRISGHVYYLTSTLEKVVFLEEGAWGDLGLMLSSPGAPMASVLVDELGDPGQKEWFYGQVLAEPTWTFFALTEPAHGSDAAAMSTTITRISPEEPWRLTGAKRYVGNAARARLGAVFARTGKGPLGVSAVLVDTDAPGFTAEPIETLGLRAAQLGAITLDSVEVAPERLLGRHLPASRRGMAGWLRTFNRLRPVVASMGVGLARAAHEYTLANRRRFSAEEQSRVEAVARRIESVRRLTRRAAAAVDADPGAGELANIAKLRAARLAEDVTLGALDFFGPAARVRHPVLEKLARDARGIEFMEGTGNIQRLSIFNRIAKGRHIND
ncbi:acyl-CoA dehydrogenase family protein [Kitasatospora sp. NPDC057542]|uniref:acyl-CoA dehydrogenase family protein n=1 Tax=Streptomycetaceae TaxID=2062 RepID=UPI001CCA49DC|nr:acyl-CoA dehydrogenase family protein [Streptomyces sp. LS1784]